MEYLAGTFAFLAEDSLRLDIEAFEADGAARLRALLVVEKNYRVEFSADLLTWTPAPVRVGAMGAALATTFPAADTQQVAIYALVSGAPGQRFYRLVLVR